MIDCDQFYAPVNPATSSCELITPCACGRPIVLECRMDRLALRVVDRDYRCACGMVTSVIMDAPGGKMATPEIGRCPWCRIQDPEEQVVEVKRWEFGGSSLRVACSCGACGPLERNRDQAIEKWNTLAKVIDGHFPVVPKLPQRIETDRVE